MTNISSLQSVTLDLPPSCVAFCPSTPQYFVVGTYFLHARSTADEAGAVDEDGSTAQKRTGSVVLFRLAKDSVTHVATLATSSAVLDVQWNPHPHVHGDLFAVAMSTGQIELYALVHGGAETAGVRLIQLTAIRVADPSILVLSIAWHPSLHRVLGFTLSDGTVVVCKLGQGETWKSPGKNAAEMDAKVNVNVTVREVYRHGLEAWTLAFPSEPTSSDVTVFSGGDDAVLACATIELSPSTSTSSTSEEDEPLSTTLWTDRRIHQAGVTAILPLHAHHFSPPDHGTGTPNIDSLVLTGSYDDHIRLLSCPAAGGRRTVLAELDLGGGVWRLKMLDLLPDTTTTAEPRGNNGRSVRILASCMHAGSRIVRLSQWHDGTWAFAVEARFTEHASMNYGSDVQPRIARGEADRTDNSIVSTSFYDRLLCLWRWPRGDVPP